MRELIHAVNWLYLLEVLAEVLALAAFPALCALWCLCII